MPLGLLIAVPIYLPMVCGLLGGILLVSQGFWRDLLLGIGLYLSSSWLCGLLELPSLPLAAIGICLREKGRLLSGAGILWLGGFWQRVAATAVVFGCYVAFVEADHSAHYWTFLIWAFAVGVGSIAPEVRYPDQVFAATIRVVEVEVTFGLLAIGRATGFPLTQIMVLTVAVLAVETLAVSMMRSVPSVAP